MEELLNQPILPAPLAPQAPITPDQNSSLPLPVTDDPYASSFASTVDPRFINKRENRFKTNDNSLELNQSASYTPAEVISTASTFMQGDMREKEEMNRGFGATANQGIDQFGSIFTNNTL
tara:strand:+ start:544 stop:903 length:360 start_codon:yes stop_codon:yes gene_type:complete